MSERNPASSLPLWASAAGTAPETLRLQDQPPFDGATYSHPRDGARLHAQLAKVREAMADHQWHTLAELAAICDAPESSVSARLRDLRKRKFGLHTIERRYAGNGLWEYRLS